MFNIRVFQFEECGSIILYYVISSLIFKVCLTIVNSRFSRHLLTMENDFWSTIAIMNCNFRWSIWYDPFSSTAESSNWKFCSPQFCDSLIWFVICDNWVTYSTWKFWIWLQIGSRNSDWELELSFLRERVLTTSKGQNIGAAIMLLLQIQAIFLSFIRNFLCIIFIKSVVA